MCACSHADEILKALKKIVWQIVENSLILLYLMKYKSKNRQEKKISFHFIDMIIIINIITIIIVIN